MKMSEWRGKLKDWLDNKLTIDDWVVDRPMIVGGTTCVIAPVDELRFQETSPSSITCTATQQIIYSVRLSDALYVELPIGYWEGVYATLAIELMKKFADIDPDILSLDIDSDRSMSTNNLTLTEANDGDGEWVLVLTWGFEFKFDIQPEQPIYPDVPITGILAGIRRSMIDNFEDNVLDAVMEIDLS